MRGHLFLSLAGFLAVGAALPATAAEKGAAPPQAYQDLVHCKSIADSAERLACYDAQVGKLEQAAASGDVVVTDRAAVREAKRGLFGFRMPTLGIFGGGDQDKEELSSIEGTVSLARQFGYGYWQVTLADGSVWEQVDTERLVFDPVKDSKIKIYRGALGTFRMNIDGQRAIKVRRVE